MSTINDAIKLIESSKTKNNKEALDLLQKADDILEYCLSLDPSNAMIFYHWGNLYVQRRKIYSSLNDVTNENESLRLAKDMFTTSLQLNPNLSQAKTALSSL